MAIAKTLERMQAVATKEVACGYPKGVAQAYPDGESVIQVAIKNCFGIGVPQRDFMAFANLLIDGDPTIKDCMTGVAKAAAENQPAVIEALQKAAGQRAADLIKEAIMTGEWEPNSPATQARKAKGGSVEGIRPLVDTGHMKNSATFVVREKST